MDVCTKDPTCKQLYNNWKEKCMTVINWTVDSKTFPICTDECKKANDDFKKNKIWRRSIDCDCGKFDDNAELKDIRQTENCFRQRQGLAIFCGKNMVVECPKGECIPKSHALITLVQHQILVNQNCAVLHTKNAANLTHAKDYMRTGRKNV